MNNSLQVAEACGELSTRVVRWCETGLMMFIEELDGTWISGFAEPYARALRYLGLKWRELTFPSRALQDCRQGYRRAAASAIAATRLSESTPRPNAVGVLHVIFAISALLAARRAWHAFLDFMFDRRYELRRRIMNASMSSPLCYGCNRKNVDALMAADGDFEKRVLIPRACPGCSDWPRMYGMLKARVRISRREACNLSGDANTFAVDGKPVHQAEVNRGAVKIDTFTPRDMIWQHNFALLNELEHVPTRRHSRFTGHKAFASFWEGCERRPKKQGVQGVGESGVLPGPRRRLAETVAQLSAMCRRAGGLFPQSLLASDHRHQDERLARIDDPTAGLARDASLYQAAVGPADSDLRALFGPGAIRIGPLLGSVSVWNNKAWHNRLGCIVYRSQPKAVYDEKSVSASRLSALMATFKRQVLTRDAIKEAYMKVLKEYPTTRELVSKKFTQAQIDDADRLLARAEVMVGKTAGNGRKGIVKFEPIAKAGKAPRAVVDEGLHLLTINAIVSRVLETLVFDRDIGVFHRLSIKHRARNLVLNELQDEWRKCKWGNLAAAEVDQTAMELHERFNPVSGGILGQIYHCIGVIARDIDGLPRTEMVRHMINNIEVDADRGVNVRYKLQLEGRDAFVKIHYDDVFMTSGWRLTSCVNFLNELFATLVAFTDDPERIFVKPRDKKKNGKRFLVQCPAFDFQFKREVQGTVKSIRFRPYVEGDDVLAMVSDCLIPIVKEIEGRYTQLGYSSRVKILSTGRAEFIGAHFLLEEGRLASTWMPALGRYLCKLGVMASANITRESIVARCCSISVMFASKLPTVAVMFHNLALSHLEGCNQDTIIRPTQYSEEERTFGVDEITLRELLGKTCLAIGVPGPDMGEQLRLVRGSLEADVTIDELARFYQLAPRIHKDYGDAAAFGFLPACLRES